MIVVKVSQVDKDGFQKFLEEREVSEDMIEQSFQIVEEFEAFLHEKKGNLESASVDNFREFSGLMIRDEKNSYDNYVALARYNYFVENMTVYLAVLELLDGSNVLEVLHEKLGLAIGEEKRDEVFEGIALPPMGTPSTEKPRFTQAIMEKLEAIVDPSTCQKALADVAHGIPREWYAEEREKFLQAENIDKYIALKRQKAIAQLEKHRDEGTLFFNQEITDEVIEFVKSHPDVLTGVREGDKIIHTKIPYLAKEYLTETDEKMKRYYYCHCAWARETIRTDEIEVSPTFCYCSAGFTKQPWEVALDQPLEVEILKSALKGDLECKFAIKLPKDVVEKAEK